MAALIAVYNSEGCVGRCDARCYDAAHVDCDCVCGGKNHGAGLERARANVAEFAAHELERWAQQQGLEPATLTVRAQADLFPFGSEPTTDEIRATLRRARRAAVDPPASLEPYKPASMPRVRL